jgi:hypothetical protein
VYSKKYQLLRSNRETSLKRLLDVELKANVVLEDKPEKLFAFKIFLFGFLNALVILMMHIASMVDNE